MMEMSKTPQEGSGHQPLCIPDSAYMLPKEIGYNEFEEITAPGTTAHDDTLPLLEIRDSILSWPEYDKVTPVDPVDRMFDAPATGVAGQIRLSELRLRPELYEQDTTTHRDAGRYAMCEAAYADQVGTYGAAKAELFETMGIPAELDPQDADNYEVQAHQAWFRSKDADVAVGAPERLFEVTVHTQNGVLYGSKETPAIIIKGYPVHTPQQAVPGVGRQLRGMMTGKVVFEGDVQTSAIRVDAVNEPKPLDEMAGRIAGDIRLEARLAALGPWTEDYRQLPPPPPGLFAEHGHDPILFGEDGFDIENAVLPPGPPTKSDQVTRLVLRGVCEDAPYVFRSMPDVPQAVFDQHLRALGPEAAARYRWLIDNVVDMRSATLQAGREAVVFGFADAFLQKLDTDIKPRAELLWTLADNLAGMERADDAAPNPADA